jgi:uncharacterized Tic20 family protein
LVTPADLGRPSVVRWRVVPAHVCTDPADRNAVTIVAGRPSRGARTAAVVAHLGLLGNASSALIMYAWPGRRSRFVREQCAEAFDFQMTYIGAYLVVVLITALGTALGVVPYEAAMVVWVLSAFGFTAFELTLEVRASVAACRGNRAHYPRSLRLLRRKLAEDIDDDDRGGGTPRSEPAPMDCA